MCVALEGQLKEHRIAHLTANAGKASETKGVPEALGVQGSISTPTTVVGTRVFQGSDVKGIQQAIEAQRDWGKPK